MFANASVGYVLYVLSWVKSNNFCESSSLAKRQIKVNKLKSKARMQLAAYRVEVRAKIMTLNYQGK